MYLVVYGGLQLPLRVVAAGPGRGHGVGVVMEVLFKFKVGLELTGG